jgi:hypothetical protein
MITRCYSRVSNQPLENWPVRPSLFETPEEFASRHSIRPEPGLSSIHDPKAKSQPTYHHGGWNRPDLDVGGFLGSYREQSQPYS